VRRRRSITMRRAVKQNRDIASPSMEHFTTTQRDTEFASLDEAEYRHVSAER